MPPDPPGWVPAKPPVAVAPPLPPLPPLPPPDGAMAWGAPVFPEDVFPAVPAASGPADDAPDAPPLNADRP